MDTRSSVSEAVFLYDSETGRLMRTYDWSRTSLGPISTWPQNLKTTVSILLRSPIPIVLLWGPDGIMIYNDAYSIFAGGRHPRLFGSKVREGWPEVADFTDNVMKVILGGGTLTYRDKALTIYRRGVPEQVWMNLDYSPVVDESGQPAGMFAVVLETTDRVLAERAQAEAEERLRALVTQTAGGISQIDMTGRYVLANRPFCEMVGYTEDELLGMRMQDITHPDDLLENLPLFQRMIETSTNFGIEKRFVRKDGSFVWANASVAPIRDAAGRVEQAVAITIDITGRKRAEEIEQRLAAIVESSDDAIISTDLNGVITSWNQGAERLYGYQAEEVMGRPFAILVPEDRQDEGQGILARISRGEHVHPFETIRQRKDGSQVEISLTVSPVRNAQGKVIGASRIARDITERRRAEDLQRVLMHELNHRVKNILATVQAIARHTFRSSQGDSTARETFDARLFALSKAHDLLTRANWGSAELSEVVAEVLAPYHRERFEIEGPDVHLPPRIALALTLALHELATNAAKYGALSVPTGRVAITWSVRPGDPAHLTFRWQERGGPPVSPPTRQGFGSRLIERSLAMELAGEVHISYDPAGVVCDVSAALADARGAGVGEVA
ncbi:PAS domain-containing sensor histidine kinase [Microvirga yunnanensis]|uniref:PAS domain-containing sensor histidine kinase n=1 Tax=Microvirga yunnanensis TaxID=2953740 RepID=UPI0021C74C93|nr:PAS domain S-box protein [Microvirga sp. HBU65207]